MERDIYILKPLLGTEVCDFCAASPTVRLYACKNFLIPPVTSNVKLEKILPGTNMQLRQSGQRHLRSALPVYASASSPDVMTHYSPRLR